MAPHAALLPSLDMHEALKDSPRFRHSLLLHTAHLSKVDQRLQEILKLVAVMTELGETYVANFYKLSVCVNQMTEEIFSANVHTAPALRTISDAYAQTVHLTKGFFEHATVGMTHKLNEFIKKDLTKVNEARNHFEQVNGQMDDALAKCVAAPRSRPADGVEARNTLSATSRLFQHTTLDYVAAIENAHAHKNEMVLDGLWSLVKEYSSFFHRGHATFMEWTSDEKGLIADSVAALSAQCKVMERKMQNIHSLVSQESRMVAGEGMSPEADVVKEGYLYKRSSNALRKWNRRWFQIKDSKLLYTHRSSDKEEPRVMEDNLMLCLVRPASAGVDRVGCFELVTPTRNHLLQAMDEMQCNEWMRALQREILSLHESHKSGSATTTLSSTTRTLGRTLMGGRTISAAAASPRLFDQLRAKEENRRCSDCGADDPKWVSINLGAVLCIECAGLHRSLGVHVSKIRSLTMDAIDDDTASMLLNMGNDMCASVFLAHPCSSSSPSPATPHCSRQEREAWIRAKYVEKRFVHAMRKVRTCTDLEGEDEEGEGEEGRYQRARSSSEHTVDVEAERRGGTTATCESVVEAAARGDLRTILCALVDGVNVNEKSEGRTPLMTAIIHKKTEAAELLLLNGARVDERDAEGNTALHLATLHKSIAGVCQLLRRGADRAALNADLLTPQQIAEKAVQDEEEDHSDDVNIITIFRVHSARDLFSEEFNNPMDEDVCMVMSDITKNSAVASFSSPNGK